MELRRRVTLDLSVAGAWHTAMDLLRAFLTDRSIQWVAPHLAPSKPTTPQPQGRNSGGRQSGGRSSAPKK